VTGLADTGWAMRPEKCEKRAMCAAMSMVKDTGRRRPCEKIAAKGSDLCVSHRAHLRKGRAVVRAP